MIRQHTISDAIIFHLIILFTAAYKFAHGKLQQLWRFLNQNRRSDWE